MQRDPRAFLWDVRDSALAIEAFIAGMDVKQYSSNAMAQAAVERKFEIIGEALNQLSKLDASLAAKIPDLPHIVAFRNQLIHGYARVNVQTVWSVIQTALPGLLSITETLLANTNPTEPPTAA
jgi:uncharacterized protein with HEPN domain